MERKEVSKRFNELPIEHRVTIIGNELDQEIRWLERQKREAIKAHKTNLKQMNDRISIITNDLRKLSD
jgi:hypothetical protein